LYLRITLEFLKKRRKLRPQTKVQRESCSQVFKSLNIFFILGIESIQKASKYSPEKQGGVGISGVEGIS